MLLRSSVLSQVRAMLGIVDSICDRCNGINHVVTYSNDDNEPVVYGKEMPSDPLMYYGNITKKDVFTELWLSNDGFASLCEILFERESVLVGVTIDVLFKMMMLTQPISLQYRAGMKHFFQETSKVQILFFIDGD